MRKLRFLKSVLIGGASALVLTGAAMADEFNIPSGDLGAALDAFAAQTGVNLIIADDAVRGARTHGAKGDFTVTAALNRILSGTGFVMHNQSGAIGIVRNTPVLMPQRPNASLQNETRLAAASAGIESVVVTSSKIKGDIQTVPIAITALSQEQLTSRQIAGGPDLVKEVPNLTFSKTNFTGYNIQIRGIGTQAISVTTDPAVAVALNDMPFIRNHFFEQEFYDVNQVEVLRGPQGTLYGRNATAGVVNVISAKPTDQFEAMLSADWGNYQNRRYEGMVNVPIVDDRLDLRVAGEWTKREGYTTNALTNSQVDGRDLWSSRVTVGWKPSENFQTYLVWEHFSENDDRMRTAKQLCKTDPTPTQIDGVPIQTGGIVRVYTPGPYLTQGCLPSSLYSPDAFEVPNGESLPYYEALSDKGAPLQSIFSNFNPYASTTQSRNLRVIETTLNPIYKAKNDTLELNADYNVTPSLTASSQTGYNQDFLWSTEDYNRFNTAEGAFIYETPQGRPTDYYDRNGLGLTTPDPNGLGHCRNTYGIDACAGLPVGASCKPVSGAYVDTEAANQYGAGYGCIPDGVYCDPQLGCSDRLVAQDLSDEKSWQLSQEFRLASHFSGPLNFSVGGNYLHYETDENYYVFINTLTMAAYAWMISTGGTRFQSLPWNPGVSDNSNCLKGGFVNFDPNAPNSTQIGVGETGSCMYIDPNPISRLNNEGHNYFLSQNPYVLNSYAGFGEVYYDLTKDLKLTGGLRWTDDEKHFTLIPSELLVPGYGYPITGIVDQKWGQLTGRSALDWTPKLDFTDQTLVYGSYSHGYKAGGANPPGATLLSFQSGDIANPIHPLTFKPEFVDAFELGTKNTLLDGGLTLNGDVFFYDYKNYQISRIVDRTSINDNFNAKVKGAELEAMWEPVPGLKFNFAGGYEDTRVDNGQSSVDLIDRADMADHPGWMVVKPFVTQASNCVIPTYVVVEMLKTTDSQGYTYTGINGICANAYNLGEDPLTLQTYTAYPGVAQGYSVPDYPGFDPLAGTPGRPYTGQNTYNGVDYGPAPNNGQGFAKNLSGNQLPNAPHFTTSLSADYTIPVSENWAATLHSDFYWQSQSFARVFNDRPYDKIRGYSTTNLALILTSADGWQAMGYVKNVFDATAITGDFLNSDDSGLTTNVFLTDPRLYGVRITKNW
ncbi:MAG TPA: TonB-dependent receptor [Rhizomicrobium sp.]|nr:TonB-dependent receptor [Rhizomicrobium sp.]